MQINNNFQKNANIAMVAQLLWRRPGISRVEIARQLDLYRSTVSNIINTLRENGVVYEDCEGSAMPQGDENPSVWVSTSASDASLY
jgi:DNA-binding transcriptional regulator LsrR (DeoR family)